MEMIERYLNYEEDILELNGKIETLEVLSDRKVEEIEERIDEAVEKLKEEKDAHSDFVRTTYTNQIKTLEDTRDTLLLSQKNVNRILKLLMLQKEIKKWTKPINTSEIKPYRDKKIIPLDFQLPKKEELLEVKLFIAETDKPKNKFALLLYGNCAFPKEMLNIPYEYGMPVSDSGSHTNIRKVLKELPTLEEIQKYAEKNKDNLLNGFWQSYLDFKKEYFEATERYNLEMFKPILDVREVSDDEAPLVCRIVDGKKKTELRLYKNFYYHLTKEEPKPSTLFIKVDGQFYEKWCVKEKMCITQTGNTMFGSWCSWWTLDIEPQHSNKHSVVFNKENFETELAEALKRIDEKNKERKKEHKIHFHPPKIEWINEKLAR